MFQVPLATSSAKINKKDFWNSLSIYHKRPHLVNRKIIAADQVLFVQIKLHNERDNRILLSDEHKYESILYDAISNHALSYEIRKLTDLKKDLITENILKNLLSTNEQYLKFINVSNLENMNELEEGHIYLSLRIIRPRMRNYSRCVELIIMDKIENFMTFFAGTMENSKMFPIPVFNYRIELTRDNFMRLTVNNFEDADTSSSEWLAGPLFSKLFKWTQNQAENTVQSLSQISIEKYCNLYEALKEKHGNSLVKDWKERTKTAPQKFIFEDIAIAAYLICLWGKEYGEEAKEIVKFVDCGCGNGLLVYILNKEGFVGFGIDIRKRNIWDLFEKTSELKVGVIKPNSIFPEATWLIGNHSDELTPWLPLIATKSSFKTNYFVIPCCPYDFNGKKYIRRNTAVSQYADYLEHIRKISENCGFQTSLDKLRIPSTKRLCLIGKRESKHVKETDESLWNRFWKRWILFQDFLLRR